VSLKRRVERLERLILEQGSRPPYLVIGSLAELEHAPRGVKIYVGFLGPDEWDETNELEKED